MDTLSSQSRQSRQRQILGKGLGYHTISKLRRVRAFPDCFQNSIENRLMNSHIYKAKIAFQKWNTGRIVMCYLQKMSSFHCSKSRKCPAWSTQTLTMNTSHSTWCTKNGEKSKKYPYASPKVPPPSPPTTYSTSLNITSPPQPLKQSKKITDD